MDGRHQPSQVCSQQHKQGSYRRQTSSRVCRGPCDAEPRWRGKRYSPRSFRVAAPFVWNNLPRHLRNDDISREQFARDLKTFLFALAYSS